MNKQVNCIGCNDESGNIFCSCMVCRLSANPGECTEFRNDFDMIIEHKTLDWDDINE